MFNKITLIGRLGQNAEARTAQNNRDYAIFNVATQEYWKNDKGEYETRTEWHRVFAWSKLSKFASTLQKGQLITLEGTYATARSKPNSTASNASPKSTPPASSASPRSNTRTIPLTELKKSSFPRQVRQPHLPPLF